MRKLFLLVFIGCNLVTKAQDTLFISIQQSDSLFLANNLSLLSQRYQIDANKAMILQAKLWDNPTLNAEFNLYNGTKKQYFDVGKGGEKIVSFDQVITLAGKRNRRVALAKAQARYTELEFYELLRTLKFELRDNFYTVYYNLNTIEKYNEQLSFLSTIISALEDQAQKGNVPLKEVLRLKAEYYQLNSNRTDLVNELQDAQQNLKTLLHTNFFVKPVLDSSSIKKYNLAVTKDRIKLINTALTNRPDLKMSENLVSQSEVNLQLQRRLGVPDLHIGGIYDQAGSYINNYTGVTLGMDLPVFNRNQGNIKYAQSMVKAMKADFENKTTQVNNEVFAAIHKLEQVESEYQLVDTSFGETFRMINDGFINNFRRRNISLIEFIDFFEAYNQSILQLNQLLERRIRTYEELNFLTGEELYK
jgi:cobalt-zinc-cadmium efflux system outer membrane protein